jgi:hypothetical protein
MKCLGHVPHVGDKKWIREFWWENLKEGDHSEDIDVGGVIILKSVLYYSNRALY